MVGDHAAWGNIRDATFDFNGVNFHVDGFAILGLQLGVCGRVGRQPANVVVDGQAVTALIYIAKLLGNLRSGFQGLVF